MWEASISDLSPGLGQHFQVKQNGQPLTYAEVLRLWAGSAPFRDFFIETLWQTPYPACFWETPPIDIEQVSRRFEFVLGPSPLLNQVRPEAEIFREQFQNSPPGDLVLSFDNLGGDARLVVPRPLQADDDYAHLISFLQNAPRDQMHALWQRVGEEAQKMLNSQTRWISTAGLGVYWLHVRLDTRPKYYRYEAYKRV
jgi:hypothetical protein